MDDGPLLSPEALAALVREPGARTEALVADLAPAQLDVPYLEIVNPLRWELGHVAFFWEVFVLRELGEREPLIERGADLFDSFTVEHRERWELELSDVEGIHAYRRRVRERLLARLQAGGERSPRETYLHQLAARHEDMHGEAFTYMRQTLGYPAPAPLAEGQRPAEVLGGGPCPGDVEVQGGTFRLGAEREAPFVFDNEKWAHPVELAPFRIARAPVTTQEYREFVEDGGYRRRELWSRVGWRWRERAGAEQPLLWERDGGGWLRRHFDRLVPLEEHTPVAHVNAHEAEAWCRWAGRRLPSEAEWERAALGEPGGGKRAYPWGDDPPRPEHANLDARLVGCVDVGAHPAGDSAWGCRQMLGNVWEWTSSDFYPFPGYVVDHPYKEYSAPWFGDRRVLRGGAWATRSRLVSGTYRNFFTPERRDVIAGFRTCAP